MSIAGNYSLYTVPVAWFIATVPHAIACPQSRTFDLRSPRTFIRRLEDDQTLSQAAKDKITRYEASHANGMDNLGLFAAAVVTGNLAALPASTLNALTVGYLASRIVYNWVYANNTTKQMAGVRSVVYYVGIGQVFALYIMAGNVLRNRGTVLS